MTKRARESLGESERRVASRIAELRRDAELTLEELGKLAGLSRSYLSRVENQKTAINLNSLELLARAFVVPVSTFFEQDSEERLCLKRAGEGKQIRLRGRRGVKVKLLAPEFHRRMMEPFIVDVNTSGEEVPIQSHEGQEFFYVLQGACILHYGQETIPLKKGDSVYFDSVIPHKVEQVGKRPCLLVATVTSKDFSFHGNLTKLLNE